MKRRLLLTGLGVVSALAAAALLLFVSSRAAPALAGHNEGVTQQDTTILARRLISVPFGIQDSLGLVGDQEVLVEGHGNCTADGNTFSLHTTVTQGTAKAKGNIQGVCQGGEGFMWSASATTNPAKTLQPGDAQACGMAIIHTDQKGAIVKKWCKDVTLFSTSP
jgi:hypothetical protein